MVNRQRVELIVQGGFGNQLFQYFAGVHFSRSLAKPLVLNLNWFDSTHKNSKFSRNFELSQLPISGEYSINFSRMPSLISRLCGQNKWLDRQNIVARNYSDLANFRSTAFILDGFFQEAKPITKNTEEVVSFLKNVAEDPAYATLVKSLKRESATCLHLRLGDYLHLKDFKVLSNDFIENSLSLIQQINPTSVYYVITDSPHEIDKLYGDVLSKWNFKMIDSRHFSSHQLIVLMSGFENLVISKSSLGWWGGFLAAHNQKLVIAPADVQSPTLGNFTVDQVIPQWHTLLN